MITKNKKIYIISILVFIFDLIIKEVIINNLHKPVNIIDNFFTITFTKNTGGAFSILSGNIVLLILISLLFLVFIIKYIEKEDKKIVKIFLSFILGGLLGNLFDRIFRKGVIDYLSFKIFNYYFPIFNLADIFIVIGVFGLLIMELRGEINEYRYRKCKNR